MNLSFLYICAIWTFWFVRQEKIAFFYVYLWQLKEYHWGRFIDHFRTEKGRRLIFHPIKIIKFAIFLSYWLVAISNSIALIWLSLVSIIYGLEFLKTLKDFNKRTLKKPVFTPKALFLLIAISLIFSMILIYTFLNEIILTNFINGLSINPIFILLLVDIISPIIISGFILALQPLSVIYRLIVIAKAKKKRLEFKNLIVIGITGSYGKTSTKEFLKTILEQNFRILATKEHQNSEIAIARCILNDLKSEHQIFICEMGAYNKGKIKEVCNIIKPNIGIITGVNEQHLALFGSKENLISAEGGIELAESLPKNGTLIINWNNETIRNTKYKTPSFAKDSAGRQNIRYCSTNEKIDIWTENIKIEKNWLYFKVCDKAGDNADFKINFIGGQNIENILLASACAKELKMTLIEIAKACEKIQTKQSTMKLIQSPTLNGFQSRTFDIIDSTYSINPNGIMAALEHLKLWSGKKVIIMPCLIELGPTAKEIHQKVGKKIGETCDLAIIITKDWFEEIKKTAIITGIDRIDPENIVFLENSKEILEKIKPYCQPESVILLEGRLPQKLIETLKNEQ